MFQLTTELTVDSKQQEAGTTTSDPSAEPSMDSEQQVDGSLIFTADHFTQKFASASLWATSANYLLQMKKQSKKLSNSTSDIKKKHLSYGK